jgi:hypothetical protein
MVSDATKTISRRNLETTEKRILLAACFLLVGSPSRHRRHGQHAKQAKRQRLQR